MTLPTAQWPAIGTTASVVVTDPAYLDAARQIVVDELAQLDLACSRFRSDSEVARLATRGNAWTAVSEVLADVLTCALDVARVTDGDVDPTMGTDMTRLGYDRDFGEIQQAAAVGSDIAVLPLTYRLVYRTTWHDVEFDHGRRHVRVPAGLALDLGAIAKAWCADRCAVRIQRELGVGVLVSLGGDIATAGVGPDGGWLVRVQDLPEATDGPNAVVVLRDGYAVATSSTISRTWRRGTSQLHHILDPATRRPAAPVWRTVTAIAGSCVDANAATTAAIVRGRAAEPWLASRGVAARLVDHDGRVHTLGGWPSEAAA
ncbi:MAG TPA: FAD:protein FMN transferase [Acidothermaceae bacterium]|nr:FAD:protein FMN transferase [Acidothermaceae bacterium]